eukprot:scaffold12009_cov105-Skeletonema_dohrnii-CCMP3373.AAC.3
MDPHQIQNLKPKIDVDVSLLHNFTTAVDDDRILLRLRLTRQSHHHHHHIVSLSAAVVKGMIIVGNRVAA